MALLVARMEQKEPSRQRKGVTSAARTRLRPPSASVVHAPGICALYQPRGEAWCDVSLDPSEK